MRDAPAHDWSLAELADTAGMSPFHFCRAFRRKPA
ncbi:helix-turn-helix transcriptional regulator [Tistrella bauzanensis]